MLRNLYVSLVGVILLSATACIAASQGSIESGVKATTELNAADKAVQEGGATPGELTLDKTHAYLEQSFMKQVEWLDDFFGSARTDNLRKASYHLRWRNSLRLDNNGKLKPATTVRANLHLSRINDRLRLYVSGENVTDTNSRALPTDPGNPGFDRTTQSAKLVNTELRYILKQTAEIDSFLGAGVRLILPPESFIRGQFRYNLKLSEIDILRLGETLFLKNRYGLGATTEISIERLLNPQRLLRLANSGTVAESIHGMEWGSELSLIQQLSPKSAIIFAGGAYGNTGGAAAVTNYRILTNYRRNFLREWLYYEIEPEVSWPRDSAGSYSSIFAVTVRLEILFISSYAAKGKK